MNVETLAEAEQFPGKEYINGIAITVWLGTGKTITFFYSAIRVGASWIFR
jgi:hypothetical protein